MNVVSLKSRIGRDWSKGKFSEGLGSIKTAAKSFLINNKNASEEDRAQTVSTDNNLATRCLKTPQSANNNIFF
jgi:hypothetical protein